MAGSRIKGITIEINGDSTKLQKALSGIDKSLQQTQAKLKDVDKLLKFDPKNTELLTQKQKALQDAVDLTRTRLQALKEAQEGVAKGTDEWDALQREIVATEHDLDSLEKQYKDFGSVGAQQIAAAGKEMQALGNKVSEVGDKLAPLSAAAAGLVASLGGLAYGSVTAADDLNTLAKQTGVSTDFLQRLKYSADLIDVSMEDVTGAITKMKKGMSGSPDAFRKLGIEVTNADGSMRDVEDIFNDVIVTLSQIGNETERDQAAYEIFGKSADSLAGIIDDGGEALKAYGDEAEALGLIMSGDTLASLNEINDTIDQNKAQITLAASELGATVAESLLPVIEKIPPIIQSITEFLQGLTPEQTQLVIGIAAVVAAISPLLGVIGTLLGIISSVMIAMPALSAAFAALTGPVGLVITVVAALAFMIATHWEEIKTVTADMVAAVKQKWDEFKTKISDTWNNIKTTISTTVTNVKNKVDEMKQKISDTATNIKTTVKNKFDEVKKAITEPIENAKKTVSDTIDNIKELFSGAKFEFPKIKLPHFSWSWTDIGGLVKIPNISIDWYKKAYENPYLFNSPTVMQTSAGLKGFGDGNGGEIVYGRDQLMRDISEAASGSVTINVYAADGMNINQLADKVQRKFVQWQRQKEAAYA